MRMVNRLTFQAWARGFDRLARIVRFRPRPSALRASVVIECSPGELIDKITILEIKSERISEPEKLLNVRRELDALRLAYDQSIARSDVVQALSAELRSVNEAIWNVEDEIRICERDGEFGPRFIELARSVYKNNDHRAALKRKVNEHLGSRIVEEKSYQADVGESLIAGLSSPSSSVAAPAGQQNRTT